MTCRTIMVPWSLLWVVMVHEPKIRSQSTKSAEDTKEISLLYCIAKSLIFWVISYVGLA